MINPVKVKIFNYFLHRLMKEVDYSDNNDYIVLKVNKLLFLTCVTSLTEDDDGLFKYLSFNAWQFGAVEADIYRNYNSQSNANYLLSTNSGLKKSDNYSEENFPNKEICILIDISVDTLLKHNPNILKYDAFWLVDITLEYFCWKYTFEPHKDNEMPLRLIKNDYKYFG